MKFERVLGLVRGEDADAAVIDTAVSMLDGGTRGLHLVNVIVVDRIFPLDVADRARYEQAERSLRNAEQSAGIRTSSRGTILQSRSMGAVLVREAAEKEVEAIVATAHITQQNGVDRLDEDSDYLLTHAPCAVILLRMPVEGFDLSHALVERQPSNGAA